MYVSSPKPLKGGDCMAAWLLFSIFTFGIGLYCGMSKSGSLSEK